MPQRSRREKHHKRTKRALTLTKRARRAENLQALRNLSILMAVLAQSGGEITITEGTMQQVAERILHLQYVTVPIAERKEVVVRLIDNTPLPGEPDAQRPDEDRTAPAAEGSEAST